MNDQRDNPAHEPAKGEDAPKSSISQGRYVPPPFVWEKHSAAENDMIRRRQRSRALVTALLLGAIVILFFFISIAKIRSGTP